MNPCVAYGGPFVNDINGKLVTNREQVLNVWEGHYSELLNHEGNMSDLELPNYVHEKLNVIEITDMQVIIGLEGRKRESTRVGRIACLYGRCSRRDWCQVDKEAVEHTHESMQSAERLANRVNCPHMVTERRCTRHMEVQRNNSAESYYETTRVDSEQEGA